MGKKEKVKKPKLVYLQAQTYSKKFENLFNSSSLSDAKIVFPKGDTYPAHKSIVGLNCEVIDKALESSDTYKFDNDVDDEAAKALVKFFYTGSLEYSDDSTLLTFMLLANKLKVKSTKDFKVPPKAYLNGVLSYVEKDLNRTSELKGLLEAVDFKKIDKEDLISLYKKKKFLQQCSPFLHQVILKDLEGDEEEEEGSDKEDDSDKDSEEEEEEEEEEEDDDEDGKPKFNVQSSNYFKLEKNKLTKVSSSNYDVIASKKGSKYTVKIGSAQGWMGLGAISESNIKNKQFLMSTSNIQGFQMWSSNGYFWEHGKSSSEYVTKAYSDGSIVEVKIKGKKIVFTNKSTKEVLERNMDNKKYKLAILLYYVNSYVEFTKK